MKEVLSLGAFVVGALCFVGRPVRRTARSPQ